MESAFGDATTDPAEFANRRYLPWLILRARPRRNRSYLSGWNLALEYHSSHSHPLFLHLTFQLSTLFSLSHFSPTLLNMSATTDFNEAARLLEEVSDAIDDGEYTPTGLVTKGSVLNSIQSTNSRGNCGTKTQNLMQRWTRLSLETTTRPAIVSRNSTGSSIVSGIGWAFLSGKVQQC